MSAPVRVEAEGPAGLVPGLMFLPAERDAGARPLPLMLLGHGGGGGKDEPRIQRIAERYCAGVGCAVLVIDGPVHGERAPRDGSPEENFRRARRALSDPARFDQMVDDWSAASKAAAAVADVDPEPTAYAGFSMGTVFGLPTVAALPSIRAAVFGVGGFFRVGGVAAVAALVSDNPAVTRIIEEEDRPEVRNDLIRRAAENLGGTEVLMLSMTRDEAFPLPGALELFDTFQCPKRLALWEGGHTHLPPEAIELSIGFLRRVLDRDASATGSIPGAW